MNRLRAAAGRALRAAVRRLPHRWQAVVRRAVGDRRPTWRGLVLAAVVVAVLVWLVGPHSAAALAVGLVGVGMMAGLVIVSDRDPAAILTVMVTLLMLVPEQYVLVGPLRSVGYPPLLIGIGCLGLWLAGRTIGLVRPRRGHPVHWLLLAFAIGTGTAFAAAMTRSLTTIESAGSLRSVFPVVAECGFALIVCDAVTSRRRLDTLLRRLVIAAGVAACVGIVEFFFTGFDYLHLVKIPGLTINVDVIADTRSSFRRVQGAASHPIEYAVAIASVVPLGLHYARFAPTRSLRRVCTLATLAMLVVLPMSVSRSAILALVVGLAYSWAQWPNRMRLNAVVLGVIGLGVFRAAVPGLLGTIKGLFLVGSKDPSIQGRTEDYAHIPALLDGHVWFGRGLGTFQPLQYFYLDNQYLGSLIEGGVIGIVLLAAVYVVGTGVARGARKRSSDPVTRGLGQALAGGIAALAATSATFDELSFLQTAFLLFLYIGAAGALWRMTQDQQRLSRVVTALSAPSAPVPVRR